MCVVRNNPVELLESRLLLSVTVSLRHGVLWVRGDDAGNGIGVGYINAEANRIGVNINGAPGPNVRARFVRLVALEGGAGSDFLGVDQSDARFAKPTLMVGWAGDDRFQGGDEPDCILAGAGSDTIYSGAGNDFLFGFEGADRISGEAGDDVISGVPDIVGNVLDGGDGNDVIFAMRGPTSGPPSGAIDTITGGNGNDSIAYDLAGTIDGGSGTDDGYPVTGSTATTNSLESSSPRGFVRLRRALGYTIDFQILDRFHVHKQSLKSQF
jgi:Ca2+-binding RTX toxin-like protein